jgi:hypothetical protein
MATQKAISGNTQRTYGGIVIPCNATLSSNSPVTDTAFRKVMATSGQVPRAISNDGRDTNEILSAGEYAHENGNIIGHATSVIAGGVSHTLLNHMGPTQFAVRRIPNQPSDSFFMAPSGIRQGYWNEYSGRFGIRPDVATVTWARDDAVVPASGYSVSQLEMVYSLGRVPKAVAIAPKTII